MRPADSHLTPREMELLLFEAADPNLTTADRAAAQEAQQHLSGCAVCQAVAQKHRDVDSALRALKLVGQPARGRDCPPDETWLHLAAGLLEEPAAAMQVRHAAQCDWCGKLLREAMEDFSQDVTQEEQAALDRLSSVRPGWQRELGKKLAQSGAVEAKPNKPKPEFSLSWWPKLVWAAAGLAVIAVAALVGVRTLRQPDVNDLLAKAYSKRRTTPLRMPGAEYGPVRMERGPNEEVPAELDTASGIIKTEIAKHPDDPSWLHAQGRAYILQRQYDKAVEKLKTALMFKPKDPDLLLDRATAYFQLGNNGDAVQDLSEVLKRNPSDAVALFNRAVVYEKMQAPDQAIIDLHHYLEIESSGPWADEARKRLEKLQQKVKEKNEALAEPLAGPNEFVRLMGDPNGKSRADQRIEDYLDLAIRKWLPAAYDPTPDSPLRSPAASALRDLATLLAELHRDQWLNDLLRTYPSPDFTTAVDALSRAVQESSEGHHARAVSESDRAAKLFQRAGSQAGALRAKVEFVHALHRLQSGEECLSQAEAIGSALHAAAYPWMQAQLDIDRCACSIKTQDFNQARRFAKQAEDEATTGSYHTLHLRRIGILAAAETDEGDIAAAWELDVKGLEQYWSDRYSPAIRSHQFYTDLALAAEDMQQWDVALALAQEGQKAIERTDDKGGQALTRALVGRLAFYAGDLDLASRELTKANELLSGLTDDITRRTYQTEAEIDLAGVELEQGQPARAEERLKPLTANLKGISSYTIPLRFYQTYARVLQKEKRLDEAEEAFQRAVRVADSSLPKLETPADRFTWSQETSKLYRQLVQVEMQKGEPQRALAIWEWYRSSRLRADSSSQIKKNRVDSFGARPAINAEQKSFDGAELDGRLARLLPTLTGRTIISYAVLPQGIAVWVFDDRGLQGRILDPDGEQTTGFAAYFVHLCADRASDISHLKRHASGLYTTLIGPVGDRLSPARSIVIELDDQLGELPFEAFLTPAGQYWGSLFRVSYSPGLFSEQQLRESSRIVSGSKALIVASSVSTDPEGQHLDSIGPQVEGEAAAVAQKFSRPTLLTGGHASFAEVEAALPDAEVFQYGGHAVSKGLQEGLLLLQSEPAAAGQPGLWGAGRIKPALMRRLQLAVFAGCSTGQTTASRLETRGEVVRSTLSAGVPHIVASRWDVDSTATTQFMEFLYSNLLSGNTVSESLAHAQGRLRAAAETQHPYYWASFAAFGRSN